jgi:hypothetical protein
MKRTAFSLSAGIAALGLWLAPPARAADHRDGAAVLVDPSTDVNDVYSWVSSDSTDTYLVMTVFPAAGSDAKFSTAAKYVFHLQSGAKYGATTTQSVQAICTFDAMQKISCWIVNGTTVLDYVTGDASVAAGLASADAKLKVFAGMRSDPFYFNLDGFKATSKDVGMAAASLMFDAAGCPMLDLSTYSTLVAQLEHAPDGTAPVDFFAKLNGLAIVLVVDTKMITPGGPILGVYGTTNK